MYHSVLVYGKFEVMEKIDLSVAVWVLADMLFFQFLLLMVTFFLKLCFFKVYSIFYSISILSLCMYIYMYLCMYMFTYNLYILYLDVYFLYICMYRCLCIIYGCV